MLFWKKLMNALLGPGHKPPPRRAVRLRLESLEEREVPAVLYTWNAAADGAWNVAANWTGGTPGQYPGQNPDDIARFDGTSAKKCTLTAPLPNALGGLTLIANFSGKVQLNTQLSVTNAALTSVLFGGTIDQPNGSGSDLTYTGGLVTWAGTVINSTATLSDLVINSGADLQIQQGAPIGDNLLNSGMVEFMGKNGMWNGMSQNVTFNNNGGISNSGSLLFEGVDGIATTGTGVITNDGVVKQTANFTVSVDLPLVNTNWCSYLEVDKGLTFTRAGQQTGVSVQQNDGQLVLVNGATLTVNYGYVQNGGTLETRGSKASSIESLGQGPVDVAIHGGLLQFHDFSSGSTFLGLSVQGFVTMDGGTWDEYVQVGASGDLYDTFSSTKGFLLGGSATLNVSTTSNTPAGGGGLNNGTTPVAPASGDTVPIMGTSGTISGDFTTKEFDPVVWTARVDPNNKGRYILTSTT